ncbi:phage baseplate assembly protein V [Endozoicomonas sp. ALC066]|uniref:phage baseplate assembly protein V n=1 Tax=Endozoicomonas sp. ALC066 TaxID=3403078 RepID=UPI003BB522F8
MPDLAGLNQLLQKLLQTGTVAEVQLNPLRYRVKFSEDRTSYWLRHGYARMADSASWDPYQKGEQVLCALPGGGRQGVVICAIDSDQHQQRSSSADVYRRDMPDGAVFEYNSKTSQLTVTLPSGAKTTVVSNGGIVLTGDLSVTGNISATESISATKNVSAGQNVSDQTGTMDSMRGTYNSHAQSHHSPPAPEMN